MLEYIPFTMHMNRLDNDQINYEEKAILEFKLIIMKIGFAPAVYIFVSLEKEFPSFLIPRSFQYSLFWAVFMFFHINFTVTIHNVSIFLTLTLAVWR